MNLVPYIVGYRLSHKTLYYPIIGCQCNIVLPGSNAAATKEDLLPGK